MQPNHFLINPADEKEKCVAAGWPEEEEEEAGGEKLTRGLLLLGHQEKQTPSSLAQFPHIKEP